MKKAHLRNPVQWVTTSDQWSLTILQHAYKLREMVSFKSAEKFLSAPKSLDYDLTMPLNLR